MAPKIGQWIERTSRSFLASHAQALPWEVTSQSASIVRALVSTLGPDWTISDGVAIHRAAQVESGATLKGPAYIGPGAFVAAGVYIRGGVWLEEDCTVGPACELKSTFMFAGSKIAHLSFVGDSVIGANVNIEAGAIIANYRNENADKRIRIMRGENCIDTGVDKFGALVGDGARIGANAVVAPGAFIPPGYVVPRLTLIDQS